ILPLAEQHGARLWPHCRALLLVREGPRVTGVIVRWRRPDGSEQLLRVDADHVFVCAGPTETPAILQRSGIRYHVGNTLRIHPYLKVAARYHETIDAEDHVLPLLQVKEFWPDQSLGGAYFTLGHLAMTLSENWPQTRTEMRHHRRMGH